MLKNAFLKSYAVLTFACFSALVQPAIRAQNVALTFDDGLNPLKQSEAASWNSAILAALSRAGIHSLLFAAGKNVDSPEGLELVSEWGKQGHGIGNHTYSHLNFASERTEVHTFIKDVEKNEAILKDVPGWTRRFRFPYLQEGNDRPKRDMFRSWLAKNEYKTGAVSIDASDWYYNNRFLEWIKSHPSGDSTVFRSAYLDHLWDRATYYDSLSRKILGRSVSHVLLLHANAINAAFLTDVIEMFRSKGWNVVSAEEAFADPVYEMRPDVVPAGNSILWSLAKKKGLRNLRNPAEDGIYEKPILDKLGL